MIKTFRGLLADGAQDRIRLGTMKGKVGYRITRFQGISNTPGTANNESTLFIYKTEQTGISVDTATVDFSNTDLLAVLYYVDEASDSTGPVDTIIFDKEVFNQDIYVSHTATGGNYPMNYYLELETMELNDLTAEYTTVKDIRTQRQNP